MSQQRDSSVAPLRPPPRGLTRQDFVGGLPPALIAAHPHEVLDRPFDGGLHGALLATLWFTWPASRSRHAQQLVEALGYAQSTSSGLPRNIGGAVLFQARAAERLPEPHYSCDDAAKRAHV